MKTLFLQDNLFILALISAFWVLPWKGYALWTSSKMGHKRWFLALLVLNTFALLEIFYIFYIVKKTPKQVFSALKTKI